MKRQEKQKSKPPFLWKERYLHADGFIKCDGCGEEKAIAKGTTYMVHLSDDGESVMNFCPRCLLAFKFKKSSLDTAFEVHPLDFQFDKLPRRFQSAWKLLSQRLTKLLNAGKDTNDAWHEVVGRLMDELGMKHLCAMDYELSKQAEQFSTAIKEIDRESAKLQKRLKSVKNELEQCVDGAAKSQFALKVEIQKRGGMDDVLDKFETLVASICKLRDAITKI